MSEDYIVQQGDCISSIAYKKGFFWETIWDHSANSDLKSKRKDPNVLMEGDIVHVPDATLGLESCASESKYKFKLNGVPSKLNVRFEFDGKPRSGVAFTLIIDGITSDGKTDGNGWVRASIPPNAVDATIVLKPEGGLPEQYVLGLGHLDPIDSITGQKARLKNLGLFAGDISEENTQDYVNAVKAFQKSCGISETGTSDLSTNDKLKQMHGS